MRNLAKGIWRKAARALPVPRCQSPLVSLLHTEQSEAPSLIEHSCIRPGGSLSRGGGSRKAKAVRTEYPTPPAGTLGAILRPHLPVELPPNCTDLLFNPDGSWVEIDGRLLSLGTVLPENQRYSLARTLAAKAGTRLDLAAPIADGVINQGAFGRVRIHAVIPPVAPQGTLLSLRLGKADGWTLDDLKERNALTDAQAQHLQELVQQRANMLISGGTGAGKSTLLSALIAAVPSGQRILLVEQDAELGTQHPHVVRLVERSANAEGAGQINLSQLIRAAMRMRPDRIVLGECRGAEVMDVLAAMNTGHPGSMATIHANSADQVETRLRALGALSGVNAETVHLQAQAANTAIIHLARHPDGTRRVERILPGLKGKT